MPRSEESRQRQRERKRQEHISGIVREMFLKKAVYPLPPGIKPTNDISELEIAVEKNIEAAVDWYEKHFCRFSTELKEIVLDPSLRPAA